MQTSYIVCAFLAKLLWLKVHKIVGVILLLRVCVPVTLTGLSACYFGHAERSAALLGLLSSLGSAALELGTRDVHCLSPPPRGEARCEGEISREDTAERRGRVSRSPVLTSKCRFPLIYFSPFFPASRGATVTLGWFHRVPCCGFAASWKWSVDAWRTGRTQKKKITKH